MVAKAFDVTQTKAWNKLQDHFNELQASSVTLKDWFAQDPNRTQKFSVELSDMYVDLSKNLMDDTTLSLFEELVEESRLTDHIKAMYSGKHINTTEDRAVLHTALRKRKDEELVVDGQNCVADVHNVLERMYSFAAKVQSGAWRGMSGKKIETVVSIGIGGSDLGPVMVYEALKVHARFGISARFVSNIDPVDLYEKTKDLNPETTLVIVTSKTFTTLETLTNARSARTWLLEGLKERGVIDGTPEQKAKAIAQHFVAVSTALDKVSEFGINPELAFGFWDWVGGRYSVDSAVGLSLILAFGKEVFEEFLAGFRAMDEHFAQAPFKKNVPMLMAMLNVWYVDFYKAHSHAVLPYSQYLHRFPAYLQQLTMESNGKHVKWDGTPVSVDTGEIFWGEAGTNGQHAFYQLIHQGTRLIPCDFIASVNTECPTKDGAQDVHELFLANFLAQTRALAFGKDADQVRAEGTPEWMVQARVFEGNRPSTSIFLKELNPHTLGELIALYEHITFVQGYMWGINSFDQWGVELGKQLALQIVPALHDDEKLHLQDLSTQTLIAYYRKHRV